MEKVRVAVAGTGYWGVNLVRSFVGTAGCRLTALCDADADRLASVARGYPAARTESHLDALLAADDIDAVVLALPAADHYDAARQVLGAGKHVFVEKPLALTYAQAKELADLADARHLTLLTGHSFEYNDAVRYTGDLISSGELGDVYYVYSQRLNLGRVRHDVDAMWNLAPHDISILMSWFGGLPETVSATGHCHLQPDTADVVIIHLRFPKGRYAHVHVSWLDPSEVRRMTVVGSKKMVVYDDVSPDRKVEIFDKGVDRKEVDTRGMGAFRTFGELQPIHRAGDVLIPKIDFKEPLLREASHFVECVRTGKTPVSDGRSGARVVAVLEAASLSMKEHGNPVAMSSIVGE